MHDGFEPNYARERDIRAKQVSVGTDAVLMAGVNREVSAGVSYKLEAPKIEITGLASITLTVGPASSRSSQRASRSSGRW